MRRGRQKVNINWICFFASWPVTVLSSSLFYWRFKNNVNEIYTQGAREHMKATANANALVIIVAVVVQKKWNEKQKAAASQEEANRNVIQRRWLEMILQSSLSCHHQRTSSGEHSFSQFFWVEKMVIFMRDRSRRRFLLTACFFDIHSMRNSASGVALPLWTDQKKYLFESQQCAGQAERLGIHFYHISCRRCKPCCAYPKKTEGFNPHSHRERN